MAYKFELKSRQNFFFAGADLFLNMICDFTWRHTSSVTAPYHQNLHLIIGHLTAEPSFNK